MSTGLPPIHSFNRHRRFGCAVLTLGWCASTLIGAESRADLAEATRALYQGDAPRAQLIAEAYRKAGKAAAGLTLVAETLAHAETTGECWWQAELCRLQGELLLQTGGKREMLEAEESFHLALTVARRQQAKSLELRAAMSLSRLWQQQGKRVEARQLLAEVYGWFTEGFDTADLQEAKALLAELAE